MDTTRSTNLNSSLSTTRCRRRYCCCNRGTGCWPRSFIAGLVFSIWGKVYGLVSFCALTFPTCRSTKMYIDGSRSLNKAFHKMGLTDAGIKWPNDILVNGRKLVGILTENVWLYGNFLYCYGHRCQCKLNKKSSRRGEVDRYIP